MQNKRIMGVDFGKVRIGIAMSDINLTIASPYETYKCKSEEKDLNHLAELIKQNQVGKVVFGLPYNMDGTEGESAKLVREFAKKLQNLTSVEIDFEDERLSSMVAEEILLQANVKREKRKELIDKIAAQVILQDYMKRRIK